MSLPQLRVRTEFSFRNCYGPIDRVAARLQDIGTPLAGIVDTRGTWGHVQWEKALAGTSVTPAFGCELTHSAGRLWVLATDPRAFYRSVSLWDDDPAALAGCLRFAGAANLPPELIDYVDINPRSMKKTLAAVELAERIGKPLVLTSDNDYPAPEDEMRFLAWDDSKKRTPQHILTADELRDAFWYLPNDVFDEAYKNTFAAAQRVAGVKLQRAPMIRVDGDLRAMVDEGKAARLAAGQIEEWTDTYEARLQRELALIQEKDYDSYFLIVADLVQWSKTKMLVGPARGSSAGSLVCYLLRITEVDPIPHGLIFERFIDVNRDDLPDIDIDFNDKKRELAFEYLEQKWGKENVARIGSVNRLKPRSVMAHAGKKLGIPHGATFAVLNVLIEYSSGDSRYGKGLEDTLANTQPGREFTERYPEASLIGELENHASHTGVHAAGIIVSNEPVIEFCTVRDGVAQVDKKDAEYLNLLKIDALGLRTLGVIEDAGVVTPEELYKLRHDDPAVLAVFNEQRFSGVFQFEGPAQRRVSAQVDINSFQRIDHVTALARPGPLGGGAAGTYVDRAAGREPVSYQHPSMESYLEETFGVVLYQEQVMRIVRELGQFSWEETSTIRKAMSGRKGKEFFDRRGEIFAEGAAKQGIGLDHAVAIWNEICSFGAWGMNKSHTTSYAVISYWCAFMKCYHPLEYAAACLRSAKDDEQVIELLREMAAEGIEAIAFDPDLSDRNWRAVDGKLVGGYTNLVGIGPVKAATYVHKRETEGLTDADYAALAKLKCKFSDLRPAHTLWGHIYANPDAFYIRGPVKEFADLRDGDEHAVICKLVRKVRRDENEAMLIAKRGGERKSGQTLFIDLHCVDDSMSKPVTVRIRPRLWKAHGESIADTAQEGKDWFLVRGRWLEQFSMMIVSRIKRLEPPGAQDGKTQRTAAV